MILGHNGFVFLGWTDPNAAPVASQFKETSLNSGDGQSEGAPVPLTVQARLEIARVRNCLVALATRFVAISPDTIMEVYNASKSAGIEPKNMLSPSSLQVITEPAVAMAAARPL